eukprot:12417902-Ditylum_brightwellii.AAC.1
MKHPQQGSLLLNNGKWEFVLGRNKSNTTTPLPNFIQNVSSLIYNKRLFQGWIPTNTVLRARFLCTTSNLTYRHIKTNHTSAEELSSLIAPALLQHVKLARQDKKIWDKSYEAEYQ